MWTIYQNNAFRILNIPSNSTPEIVRNAQQSMKIRIKAGGLTIVKDPLSFFDTIERNEFLIRDAFNRLNSPKSRIQEKFFWFTNISQADEYAIAQLTTNNALEAIKIWESEKTVESRANLARLFHILCINKDPNTEKPWLWEEALEKWRKIFESEAFWDQFSDFEMKSEFEPLASIYDINVLRKKSFEIILKPSIGIIKKAIYKEKHDIAQRHLDLIRYSKFPLIVKNRIEAEIIAPLEKKIENSANQILTVLSNLTDDDELTFEKIIDKCYDLYGLEVLSQLKQIERIVGKNCESVKRVRETAASCLRNIAVMGYHNRAYAYQRAKKLLKEAINLIPDSHHAERWRDKDLPILKKHADMYGVAKKDAEKKTLLKFILKGKE